MATSCLLAAPFLLLASFLHVAPVPSFSQSSSPTTQSATTMATLSNLLLHNPFWNATGSDFCTWQAVTCDSNRRVTRISLSRLAIKPETQDHLFSLLCRLGSLESLDLSDNLLKGTFPAATFASPACIETMAQLKSLNLSSNQLSGQLPPLTMLPSLESLDLSCNRLEGLLDTQLSALLTLKSLNLSSNHFSGPIPVASSSLVELQLSRNSFFGEIPLPLLSFQNLSLLDLSWNSLSGPLPDSISDLPKLETLLLSSNNFSDQLPATLSKTGMLSTFTANQNRFSGAIPPKITGGGRMKHLDLSYNSLTGSIPVDLLGSNSLLSVDFTSNSLTGPIPYNLSGSLYRLRLSQNRLNGTIPGTIGNLSSLTYLELDGNGLTGGIPPELSSCKNLSLLNLGTNNLQGQLPKELGKLTELAVLKLQMNKINGTIPDEVSELGKLLTLNLSHNSLSGPIPPSISSLRNLSTLILESNRLSGPIPRQINLLKSLTELELGNNQLESPIPEMPRTLAAALNLSGNRFTGLIPESFKLLQDLEVLDLSNNNFTGEVPSGLTGMKSLTHLVVSNNQLTGILPKFNRLVNVEIAGNEGLRFSSDTYYLQRERRPGSYPVVLVVFVTIISAIIGSGFAAAILIFLASRQARRLQQRVQDGELEEQYPEENNLPPHQPILSSRVAAAEGSSIHHRSRIDFREAMEAVRDPANVFHKTKFSTYYTVSMTWSGATYSVKKLAWSDKGVNNSQRLGKELDVLGRLMKNAHVMTLLAYSLTADSAYLFYEHSHYGTVWDALHSADNGGLVLDWPSRYSIAIGIARGLTFLHGDIQPPLILLDLSTRTVFRKTPQLAQIGDVELCKVVDTSKSTAVACSVGYVPPEYAYSMRVTAAGNIYSFGVVLLELVTGKPPVSDGVELAKWALSCSSRDQILDSRISTTDVARRQMLTVLRMALRCMNHYPDARPRARDILGLLQTR